MMGIIQSFRNKDSKSFVFLLWGSLAFLSFFAMTLKFTSDQRHAEHMMHLHSRYYFAIYPFFLIAFIAFLGKLEHSILASIGFVIMSLGVSSALIKIFPIFFLPYWGSHVDFPEWSWLNTFFPVYRGVVDPQGWDWWGSENINIVLAVLVALLFLISLYYAFSTVKRFWPYLLFFILFSILSNALEIRIQTGLSNINLKKVANHRAMIESTIDSEEPVMLIGSWAGIDMLLVFCLSYKNIEARMLPQGALVTDDKISPRTKWLILLDRYLVNARMELFRTDGVISIYHFAKGDEDPFLK
jgi:hypothetical protein